MNELRASDGAERTDGARNLRLRVLSRKRARRVTHRICTGTVGPRAQLTDQRPPEEKLGKHVVAQSYAKTTTAFERRKYNRRVHSIRRITRVGGSDAGERDDLVVIEEPLEIRIDEKPVSVTLRTPGDDFDLAAGFLFSESILRDMRQVASFRHWGSPNVVRVSLDAGASVDLQRLQRHFFSTSSCGVCGKVTIDALRAKTTPIESEVAIGAGALSSLPTALRASQQAFDATGAIHAAGVFTLDGGLLRMKEDVGRHNAVDKVIGSFFREGLSLEAHVLMVSGRASFEIVQKAIVARIPILAAVGAPSSMAVDLAEEFGLTLLGFVREERFNVYTRGERVITGPVNPPRSNANARPSPRG